MLVLVDIRQQLDSHRTQLESSFTPRQIDGHRSKFVFLLPFPPFNLPWQYARAGGNMKKTFVGATGPRPSA
jgi:hypothetical protein